MDLGRQRAGTEGPRLEAQKAKSGCGVLVAASSPPARLSVERCKFP